MAVYPLGKRFFPVPALIMGFGVGLSLFSSYAIVAGSVSLIPCMPMYISAIAWNLLYETFYQSVDREDDRKIGLKNPSLYFENHIKLWLSFNATVA